MSVTYMRTLNMNDTIPEWRTTALEGYGYYSEKQAKQTGNLNYYLDTNDKKVLVTEVTKRITTKPLWKDAIYIGPLKSYISKI